MSDILCGKWSAEGPRGNSCISKKRGVSIMSCILVFKKLVNDGLEVMERIRSYKFGL